MLATSAAGQGMPEARQQWQPHAAQKQPQASAQQQQPRQQSAGAQGAAGRLDQQLQQLQQQNEQLQQEYVLKRSHQHTVAAKPMCCEYHSMAQTKQSCARHNMWCCLTRGLCSCLCLWL